MDALKTGMTFKCEMTVRYEDTAISHNSGGLAVFATPAMVALMEKAAFTLAKECGADTVGTELNISHTRACKTGSLVYSIAKLTEIDGKRLKYEVSAYDEKGEIGKGTHTRYIITDIDKFIGRL